VRFLAARVPLELDVYTITPTHNFSGPNRHFLAAFRELNRLRTLRLAHYSHFQLMETDTYPLVSGWAVQLASVAAHQPTRVENGTDGGGSRAVAGRAAAAARSKPWVRGGLSICLSAADAGLIPEHINGNALYTLSPSTFHEHLQAELRARMHTWAFDVMIGYWLRSVHPGKLAPSEHVISISSFQRSHSCCELVGEIVRAAAAASTDGAGGAVAGDGEDSAGARGGARDGCDVRIPAHPRALLLHTGNIEKMPDATVHPAMRRLGASLQDIFVPRGSTPCAALLTGEHSALPLELRIRYAHVAPWRAPLKALSGGCAAPRGTPTALWWAPQLRPGGFGTALARRDGPGTAGWLPLGCAALRAAAGQRGRDGHLSPSAPVHARCDERRRLDDLLNFGSGAGDGLAGGGDGLGGSATRTDAGFADAESSAVLVVALQPPDMLVWDAFLSHRFPELAEDIRQADSESLGDDIRGGSDRADAEAAAEAAILALEAEAMQEVEEERDGRLSPLQLAERVAWVAALGRNPVVCALSGVAVSARRARVLPNASRPSLLLGGASDADTGRGGGPADQTTACDAASTDALRDAIAVLRERALVLPLGDDVVSALHTVGTYFGGSGTPPVPSVGSRARLLLANRTRSALGVFVPPPEWLRIAVLGAEASTSGPLGAAARVAGAAAGVFGAAQGSMLLDHALYHEVLRLAAEQRRSIVWSEPAEGDVCAVADDAAAAREAPRPEPLELSEKLLLDFEGDGSRVFEVVLPPPHTRSLVLLLKASNLVGASDISINLLVSHVTAAPSFSDHEFRWWRRKREPGPVFFHSSGTSRRTQPLCPMAMALPARRHALTLSRPSVSQVCLRVLSPPPRLEGPLHSQIGPAARLLRGSHAASS
jgi:hypothetical protein